MNFLDKFLKTKKTKKKEDHKRPCAENPRRYLDHCMANPDQIAEGGHSIVNGKLRLGRYGDTGRDN